MQPLKERKRVNETRACILNCEKLFCSQPLVETRLRNNANAPNNNHSYRFPPPTAKNVRRVMYSIKRKSYSFLKQWIRQRGSLL